jgi:hypothetical protein
VLQPWASEPKKKVILLSCLPPLLTPQVGGVTEEESAAAEQAQQVYVRGEENLGSWRPRSLSLVADHQQHMAAQERLYMVRAF